MRIEKIGRVEQVRKIQNKDLTQKQFDATLSEKRKKFKERLQQGVKKDEEDLEDKQKAQAELDIARQAFEFKMKNYDSVEMEK